MVQDVKPTRSELLVIKKKIKLAETGYKLLKKKRDGLILEFFKVLNHAKEIRRQLNEKYRKATKKMNEAVALDGMAEVKSLSLAIKNTNVDISIRNIMGVSIPEINTSQLKESVGKRGYGFLSTSIRMEEMTKNYSDLVEASVKAAETETKLRKILLEIEKTKKRVNSLEYLIIPRLNYQASMIRLRLEEMDRENIFRMKKIKQQISG
jgi:V/A-type H+/Na+-transporting ATPase subunit D